MSSQILCVGMSDCSAGTGLQADIKTIQALGGYAATVVTTISVQNTVDMIDLYPIPESVVRAQIKAVMSDLDPSVVKLGMLASENTINAVGDFLEQNRTKGLRLVVDPVMLGRLGIMLLDKPARDALKRSLLIFADIVTPNIREAQELTGLAITDIDMMKKAAEMFMTLGCKAAVIKGGALGSDKIHNVYFDDKGPEVFDMPRLDSKSTHGAGTTLAAGIAAGLAQQMTTRDAFIRAQDFLVQAIARGEKIGSGYGPLNHSFVLTEKNV